MKILSKDNYFSVNNKALTNSKIKDFLKNKEYFYKKHISGEITQKKSAALDTGKAVDDLLTCIDGIDSNIYSVVERRNLKNPPEGVIEVNASQYEEILGLATAVANTDAYKYLINNHYARQQILQIPRKLGRYFGSLAGIPDFYHVGQDWECHIVDLKTTQSINPRRYHLSCLEYGYYRQMAFYALLLKVITPEIKSFKYHHLAVEKKPDIYNVETFELDGNRISEEQRILEDEILPMIAAERDFKPWNPRFESATLIGALNSNEDF